MATGKAASQQRSSVRSLSKQLSSLSKTASGVASTAKAQGKDTTGITNAINRSNAMVSQTERQGSKSFGGSTEEKGYLSNVITPASTAPVVQAKIPAPVQTVAPEVTAGNVGITGGETGMTKTDTGLTVDPITQQYLDTGRTAYDKLYADITKLQGEQPTEASIRKQVEKESGIKQYRQQVNDVSAQINNIIAARDAQNQSFVGQGRGVPEAIIGGQQEQTNREAYIKAAPLQALLANAQGNLDTAKEYVNTWGQILANDANNKYNNKVKLIESLYNFGTSQDKLKFDSLQAQAKEKKDAAIALAAFKTQTMQNALGQNAPASIINGITNATDSAGVVAAAGIYNGDVLARRIQQAQLAKLTAPDTTVTPQQISATIQQSVSDANPITVKSSLAALLGSNAIAPATKARISPSLAVLNSVDEIANSNIEGKFTGIGLGGRFKEGIKGLFGAKSPEAITNAQNIEAINLKVQQWASGAALTDAQTKQVARLTPTLNDRDTTVKSKLNGLYNFMLNQAESDLLTEGVNVQFPAVNLFEISDLYAKASPEQKTLIEQTYFNKQ